MRSQLAVIAVIASVVLAAAAAPAAAGGPPTRGVVSPSTASGAEVLGFWTPERLASATASAMPAAGRTPPGRSRTTAPRRRTRVTAAPRVRSSLRIPAARRSRPRLRTPSPAYAGQGLPWASNGYGTGRASNAVGRLFYTLPNGQQSFCSAAAVATNIVLTAAHCVQDGATGAWNRNWIFVPAVDGANQPYGQFPARTATAPRAWAQAGFNNAPGTGGQGYFAMDYAYVVLGRNSAGYDVGQYTGWFPIAANAPKGNVYHLGYPGEGLWAPGCTASFCRPWYCAAPIQRYNQYVGGKFDVGLSCYNSGGSSGGPWFQTVDGRSVITSVQSHMGPVGQAGGGRYGTTFFGPYLDGSALQLFAYARTL